MIALALHLAGGTDVDRSEEHADAHLLRAAARRDPEAFTQLVKRHYPVVYRVVWRLMNGRGEAEDLTQEAFLRFWNNPAQIREPAALRGWLIRVASNLAIDGSKNRRLQIGEATEIVDPKPLVQVSMEREHVAARIDQAIARLPERQKLAITLVQFEQFSNIKAAEVMQVSVDALESLLARARRALKQDLQGEWQDLLSSIAASEG
jgi:RNA polymerase sigma-70 factor, ECF subfamily